MSNKREHNKGLHILPQMQLHQNDNKSGNVQKTLQTRANEGLSIAFVYGTMLVGALGIIGKVEPIGRYLTLIVGGLFLTAIGLAASQSLVKYYCLRGRGQQCVRENNKDSNNYEMNHEDKKCKHYCKVCSFAGLLFIPVIICLLGVSMLVIVFGVFIGIKINRAPP